MTYDQAVALAQSETWVRRLHWHWIYLSSRPDKRNPKKRVLVIVDEDGTVGEKYRPTLNDQRATDWEKMQ